MTRRAEHPFSSPTGSGYCDHAHPRTFELCGLPPDRHRVRAPAPGRVREYKPEHHAVEDPCIFTSPDGKVCGLPAKYHRLRDRVKAEPRAPKDPQDPKPRRERRAYKKRAKPNTRAYVSVNTEPIVGIDGEGQGRHVTPCPCDQNFLVTEPGSAKPTFCPRCGVPGMPHPPHAPGKCRVGIPTGDTHRYTYLAAVDEDGVVKGEIRNPHGLPTVDCLTFFLELGVRRVFGFAIGYDLTKILADLPAKHLYFLNRPDKRRAKRDDGSNYQKPVDWRGFRLGYLRGQLTIRRVKWSKPKKRSMAYGPSIVIWDCFRFFQSKFTTALIDWQIADKAKLERMSRMKDLRAEFDKLTEREIESYCKEECHYLAKLVRRLIEAHEEVGLKLKNFFGAGSTAKAILNKHEIRQYIAPPPPEMKQAVACGFFGGRFETSHVGPIAVPVYNYDISSAYPYHITHLPCLACGHWDHVPAGSRDLQRRIENGRLALVLAVPRDLGKRMPEAWGPFPWRSEDGCILFPRSSGGSWVWQDEFLAAQKIFPQVTAKEAWVYESGCVHTPFSMVPEIFAERVRIGKSGPGLVLKTGMNSLYGSTAQTKGATPFQSFVWAGVITSNTRAQLLSGLACLPPEEWWSVLMFATDGIFSTKELALPAPRETGTGELPNEKGEMVRKPLGGWETDIYKRGIFIMRPGIYFPLSPTKDEIKEVKARGMSKAVLLDNAAAIEAHYDEHGIARPFEIEGLQRFVGMVSGVTAGTKTSGPKRSPDYGEWVPYPIVASFSPQPKRARLLSGARLETFKRCAGVSTPYKRANLSAEAIQMKEAEMFLGEQASGDFCET